VVAFFTHGAQFRTFSGGNWQTVSTMALALQNTGRAIAENIRIIHRRQPLNYQVHPPSNHTEGQSQSGEWELRIPAILAKQTVFVSYLDGLQLDQSLITYMASKDQVIHQVRIQFMRVWPKWLQYSLVVLCLFGALTVLHFLYTWGLLVVHYVASH